MLLSFLYLTQYYLRLLVLCQTFTYPKKFLMTLFSWYETVYRAIFYLLGRSCSLYPRVLQNFSRLPKSLPLVDDLLDWRVLDVVLA